jgi:hypothetical protein
MQRTSHALLGEDGVWIFDPIAWEPALERISELGKPAALSSCSTATSATAPRLRRCSASRTSPLLSRAPGPGADRRRRFPVARARRLGTQTAGAGLCRCARDGAVLPRP